MALTEKRVLKQVSVLPEQHAINVQWANQVLRDSDIISETYERKSYQESNKEEFLLEVDNAQSFIPIMGW